MALYDDLKDIVSQINTFVDSLWACISAEITEENIGILLSDPSVATASLFTSSVQFDQFDIAISKVKGSIKSFNNKIDDKEIIPRDGYLTLLRSVNNSTHDVRLISNSVYRHVDLHEFSVEYRRKFDLVVSKYADLLGDLNKCVIKYNNRHAHSQSLKPLFSVKVTPIKG
jgi:hypothetical protein